MATRNAKTFGKLSIVSTLVDAAVGAHIADLLAERPADGVGVRIDPNQIEVYACGLNAMVYSLERTVRQLGVRNHHVHCEGYG
jgi:ferredoxin-NADP reductase